MKKVDDLDISNDKKQLLKFAKALLIIGLFGSCVAAFFLLFQDKPWSIWTIFYTFIETILLGGIGISIICVFEHKHSTKVYKSKKYKIVIVALFLVLVLLNILLWRVKKIEFEEITLSELTEAEESMNSERYFVIYTTRNCMYCNKMMPIYEEAALKYPAEQIFYVDLSDEIIGDKEVQKRNIDALPILASYEKGVERKRIEGMASVDDIIDFLKI